MSLTSWFRDYVYIPLGGNRVKQYRHYINLMVLFLLSGFWHGANWNFIFWGLLHGTYVIIYFLTVSIRKRFLIWSGLHKLSMLRNLAAQVLLYEKVKTTEAKAKAVKPLVEKAITLSKKPSLHVRRELQTFFYTKNPVIKLFDDLSKRYQNRSGGYTRIVRLGPRQGDGAKMVQIELV